MNNSKVSIVVPIYNTEAYLERCVDSILAQIYDNIEIILVDDGSSDSSPEICDRYAERNSRVKVVHKKNGGLSSARNAGLNVATGDYIGFVDSDDYVSTDMYGLLVERLEGSNCDISNVMYVRVDEEGNETPSRVTHMADCEISSEQFVRELMLHTGDVSVCTKLFRAELFEKVRFSEGKLNEDLLFMLEMLSVVKSVAFVGRVGYYYFTRSGSISGGYGKAVIDMVGNSLKAKETVDRSYSKLKRETERFAIYQHFAYLLLVPKYDAVKSNEVYINALRYLRKHAFKSFLNKYLSIKNKIIIFMLAIAPKATANMYQKKRAK